MKVIWKSNFRQLPDLNSFDIGNALDQHEDAYGFNIFLIKDSDGSTNWSYSTPDFGASDAEHITANAVGDFGEDYTLLFEKRPAAGNGQYSAIDNVSFSEEPISEPGTQVSNIASDNIGDTSIELSWDNGNGEGRLIICRAEEEPSSGPVDGTDYTANNTFGSGTSLGNGSVVYKDSGDSVIIDGLTANTEYYFQAYEYNGDTEPDYNPATATGNPKSITTTPEPGMFFGIIVLGLSIIRIKC